MKILQNHAGVILLAMLVFVSSNTVATVVLRDSVIGWQHHRYTTNADYSMKTMTTADNDIVSVQFAGKVIENDLFRIVLVPEFGGRVLLYFYKPTAHEYLYQSPCGTPYGISQGNFYYNWLMVYGGIFPTFPEPEHGKTWLKPWQYTVVKSTADTVIVRMSLTDNTEYSGRPGQFNNGITGITCEVEVGVYTGQAGFSFNVKLTNPAAQTKKYEYWTCTTLTPGSVPGNTFSPVKSEMVVPMNTYEAAWSTNNWIGTYGKTFDFSKINMLDEWSEMGIAYATTRTDDYWGVINHVNDEGFFRIADRTITKGLKLWTWGRDAVNANKLSISNGGKDDYIELWGGLGMHFFDDATFNASSQLSWPEYFYPTVGLPGITAMNNQGGAFIDLDSNTGTGIFNLKLNYFLTQPDKNYTVEFYPNQNNTIPLFTENIVSGRRGNLIQKPVQSGAFMNGLNNLKAILKNEKGEIVLTAQKQFSLSNTVVSSPGDDNSLVHILNPVRHQLDFIVENDLSGEVSIYSLEGKVVFTGSLLNGIKVDVPVSGIYIVQMKLENRIITKKIGLY